MTTTFYEAGDDPEEEHDVCWCGQAPCTHLKSRVADVFNAVGWDCL